MLLQTNSYVVPKERRSEHARLVRRFKQVLHRLGCDQFEVYEQVGTNWTSDQNSGRFVQIMRFRDRKQQLAVQAAERDDPIAQAVIAEFCELINFPYQQQQGLFAIGYYTSILGSGKLLEAPPESAPAPPPEATPVAMGSMGEQMTMVVDQEELAETVAEQTPVHAAAPIRNPFAEAPIVAPIHVPEEVEAAGSNGDGHGEELGGGQAGRAGTAVSTAAPNAQSLPHSAVDDLDELIRQHFGGVDTGTNGESAGPVSADLTGEPSGDLSGDLPGHTLEDRMAKGLAAGSEKASTGGPEPVSGEVIEDASVGIFDVAEDATPDAGAPKEVLPGSGIGAVLEASLRDDDADLDIPLPAELLDQPESSVTHISEPSRIHHEKHPD